MKKLSTFALFFWSIFLFSQIKEKQDYVYLKRPTNRLEHLKEHFRENRFIPNSDLIKLPLI